LLPSQAVDIQPPQLLEVAILFLHNMIWVVDETDQVLLLRRIILMSITADYRTKTDDSAVKSLMVKGQ
jgi:hypothetical protein